MATTQVLKNGVAPQVYIDAEISGMENLQAWIKDIVECCDPGIRNSCSLCSWKYGDVVDYHSFMEFETFDCEVTPASSGVDSLCLCSYDYQMNNSTYSDGTNEVTLSVGFSEIELPESNSIAVTAIFDFLSALSDLYTQEGKSFYAALTDQTMFCSEDDINTFRFSGGAIVNYDEIESKFLSCDVGIWYNILYTDNVARIAVKVKGLDHTLHLLRDSQASH